MLSSTLSISQTELVERLYIPSKERSHKCIISSNNWVVPWFGESELKDLAVTNRGKRILSDYLVHAQYRISVSRSANAA